MRSLIFLLSVLVAPSVVAQIYQSVDDSGNVVFSDRPMGEDSAPVELQQPSTYAPRPLPPLGGTAQPAGLATQAPGPAATALYSRVEIVSPGQDATIRDNTGRVEVSIQLEPRLRPNHSLALMLDGEVLYGGLKTPGIALSNVDRGTHELQVVVNDASGAEVSRSDPVTFHMHRVIARPTPPPPPRN